jgi:hypothetical protein
MERRGGRAEINTKRAGGSEVILRLPMGAT